MNQLIKLFALVLTLGFMSVTSWGQSVEIPKFDKNLEKLGITKEYSETGYKALVLALYERSNQLQQTDDEDTEKLSDYLRDVAELTEEMEQNEESVKRQQYDRARQFLYSIETELHGDRGLKGARKVAVAFKLLSQFTTRLPYLTPSQQNVPLKTTAASKEAADLSDPLSGKSFPRPEDLIGLSPNQISNLDISAHNTMMYTEHEMQKRREHAIQSGISSTGSLYELFEHEMQQAVSRVIGKDYNLAQGRKVVLFEGIKSTATSPKVDVKDLMNQKWKAKWGEEVQTEPVVNRLYMEIGAKFTDLVYGTRPGPNETLFVLNKTEDSPLDSSDCTKISTVQKLKSCMLSSKYKFNIAPYIHRTGTLKEYDIHEMGIDANATSLVGREYVVFKELSLEFQPPRKAYDRLGPAGMSLSASLEDRARRGMVVFNSWIRNRDAKDANNKGVIANQDPNTYIEYFHDLGASIAGFRSTGSLNSYRYGRHFVEVRENRAENRNVVYHGLVLYQPKAFLQATWADQRWMARRILTIPSSAMNQAVDASQWPDFMRRILLHRLTQRQADLAKIFYPEWQLAPVDLKEFSVEYNSSMSIIEKEEFVRSIGLTNLFANTNRTSSEALAIRFLEAELKKLGAKSIEPIVTVNKKGEPVIETCRKSALVNILELSVYPGGLSTRIKRSKDDKVRSCIYEAQRTHRIPGRTSNGRN